MSDRMTPLSFASLMERCLTDYAREGAALGLRGIHRYAGGDTLPLFGRALEAPFGPAAGPHTQLSQNLVAAYLAGARFFELKTVQTLDGPDLPVQKPCISAADEGYNVEWSTELRVEQARDEYIRAWFAIQLLCRAWSLGRPDDFAFNMSVGYDYAGITSPKIDGFIDALKDARRTEAWRACVAWAEAHPLPGVSRADVAAIDPHVCESVTLSTLHGCPPQEIERIAVHLIREKRLHTFVKCNPTLLGYQSARDILDRHRFDSVRFDDTHFRGDLQWDDALPMLRRLRALADETGVTFGVKLSNTFPVQITRGELPGEEMYMSGRALYPLTVELSARLAEAFHGDLRVSYSGGADAENLASLLRAGIWPVTVATTLLKPGGYDRLRQMAGRVPDAASIPKRGVRRDALARVRRDADENPRYLAPLKPPQTCAPEGRAPLLDCAEAPCTQGCPLHQDAPAYLTLAGQGRYAEALAVICRKNPLPSVTGTICNHRCSARCTRRFYEESVRIREVKRLCAERGMAAFLPTLSPAAPRPEKVAVIGGGPAGMAAAFFLARAGASVTLFERQSALGGMVRYAIPAFRIPDATIDADAALLARLGVDVRLGAPAPDADALRAAGYTHTLLCVGAWKPGALTLEGDAPTNAIAFLRQAKTAPQSAGPDVCVIGGGNTAMDAARAALRLPGVERVTLAYRRTRAQMPADPEELQAALDDGVRLLELTAPEAYHGGKLRCRRMRLGDPDASGRQAPVSTDETFELAADTLVAAVGERVDADALAAYGISPDAGGAGNAAPQGVWVLGDAKRGPGTVAQAIADAQEAAAAIVGEAFAAQPDSAAKAIDPAVRGALCAACDAEREPARCLHCGLACEVCVEVCPNRANLAVEANGKRQILHLDALCNECGNCATFCPHEGAPYRDKLTWFIGEDALLDSRNEGFALATDGQAVLRLNGTVYRDDPDGLPRTPPEVAAVVRAALERR